MKNLGKWLLTLYMSLIITDLLAQHCPFDGYYTLAIRISKAGKSGPIPDFYLLEK